MRTSDVLPVPLGPSTARNSPSCRSKPRSSQSTRAPKRSDTCARPTTGGTLRRSPAQRSLPAPRPGEAASAWKVAPGGSVSVTPITGMPAAWAAVRMRVRDRRDRLRRCTSSTRTRWPVKRPFIVGDRRGDGLASVLDRAGERGPASDCGGRRQRAGSPAPARCRRRALPPYAGPDRGHLAPQRREAGARTGAARPGRRRGGRGSARSSPDAIAAGDPVEPGHVVPQVRVRVGAVDAEHIGHR